MKKYILEIIILLAGTITMVFEIVGSRVLGPYFGASIFVWTSLIGIIMGSLSLGYWLGGKFSEKQSSFRFLSWMLLLAGFFIFLNAIGHDYVLARIIKYIPDFRFKTVVSVIILFAPASVFLGMVLPYAVKLKIESIRTSGSLIGNLYALSTIGSIIGTFMAGFILVPAFGFSNILFALSVILVLIALADFIMVRKLIPGSLTVALCICILFFWIKKHNQRLDYIDTDTQYNRVLIYNTTDQVTGRPVKMLNVNDEQSSAMFLDKDDDLVFEVLKYYRLVEHFNPNFSTALMIGGSGYAFPKDYLNRYPEAHIDVVEIDPGLTELARLHFNLPDDQRLNIYHEDGRTFLNRCDKKYDAVFMDAYKSMITIPFQLTTQEAVQHIFDMLNDDGAIYANVISSLDSKNNYFLRSEVATYKSVFPQVYLFAVQYPEPTEEEKSKFQNFLLVGLKTKLIPEFSSINNQMNQYLSHLYKGDLEFEEEILTDNYAPVEYYASKALR
ncbi:MAG: fused MFS/spermidine synthase [Bacteroidales bacterium]|nr:fused MFS/spermidine synthase [Bacteroidales bacterium]